MRTLLIYMLLLLQVILSVSCNKWLDVKPSSEMEREDLYSSEGGFESSLSGCYIALKGSMLYGQSLTMTTIEYLAQHWHTEAEDVENFMDFDWEADYSKGQMSSIFSNMYNVVNQVNDLLIQLEKKGEEVIPEDELRNLIKGEALAMRAFCHFDILRLFGPSPKDPNKTSVQLPYSEQSGKEFRPYYAYDAYCEKMLNDLHQASTLLEQVDPVMEMSFETLNNPSKLLDEYKIIDDFQAYRRLRFNYWAVKALEARIALYLGDTETAYECAKLVMDARVENAPVGDISALSADFANEYYSLPSETLLALNVFDLEDDIQSIFRNAQTVLYKWETPAEVLLNLFDNETSDSRYSSLWTSMDYETQRKMGIKKYWQLDAEENDDAAIYGQQIPLLRMSEMYLIAIETASTLAEGNALLDEFRRARGLQTKTCATKEELNAEVLKEYQKEFYAEGQMFFQYKRLGATNMNWKNRAIEISEYQIPLPETEYNYQ